MSAGFTRRAPGSLSRPVSGSRRRLVSSCDHGLRRVKGRRRRCVAHRLRPRCRGRRCACPAPHGASNPASHAPSRSADSSPKDRRPRVRSLNGAPQLSRVSQSLSRRSRPYPSVSDGPGPDRTRNALATPAPEQARRTRRRARAARKGPTRSAAARRTLSAAARAAARSRPSSASSSSCARPLSRAPGRRERPSEQPIRSTWGG